MPIKMAHSLTLLIGEAKNYTLAVLDEIDAKLVEVNAGPHGEIKYVTGPEDSRIPTIIAASHPEVVVLVDLAAIYVSAINLIPGQVRTYKLLVSRYQFGVAATFGTIESVPSTLQPQPLGSAPPSIPQPSQTGALPLSVPEAQVATRPTLPILVLPRTLVLMLESFAVAHSVEVLKIIDTQLAEANLLPRGEIEIIPSGVEPGAYTRDLVSRIRPVEVLKILETKDTKLSLVVDEKSEATHILRIPSGILRSGLSLASVFGVHPEGRTLVVIPYFMVWRLRPEILEVIDAKLAAVGLPARGRIEIASADSENYLRTQSEAARLEVVPGGHGHTIPEIEVVDAKSSNYRLILPEAMLLDPDTEDFTLGRLLHFNREARRFSRPKPQRFRGRSQGLTLILIKQTTLTSTPATALDLIESQFRSVGLPLNFRVKVYFPEEEFYDDEEIISMVAEYRPDAIVTIVSGPSLGLYQSGYIGLRPMYNLELPSTPGTGTLEVLLQRQLPSVPISTEPLDPQDRFIMHQSSNETDFWTLIVIGRDIVDRVPAYLLRTIEYKLHHQGLPDYERIRIISDTPEAISELVFRLNPRAVLQITLDSQASELSNIEPLVSGVRVPIYVLRIPVAMALDSGSVRAPSMELVVTHPWFFSQPRLDSPESKLGLPEIPWTLLLISAEDARRYPTSVLKRIDFATGEQNYDELPLRGSTEIVPTGVEIEAYARDAIPRLQPAAILEFVATEDDEDEYLIQPQYELAVPRFYVNVPASSRLASESSPESIAQALVSGVELEFKIPAWTLVLLTQHVADHYPDSLLDAIETRISELGMPTPLRVEAIPRSQTLVQYTEEAIARLQPQAVVYVSLVPELIELKLPGIRFEQIDLQIHPLPERTALARISEVLARKIPMLIITPRAPVLVLIPETIAQGYAAESVEVIIRQLIEEKYTLQVQILHLSPDQMATLGDLGPLVTEREALAVVIVKEEGPRRYEPDSPVPTHYVSLPRALSLAPGSEQPTLSMAVEDEAYLDLETKVPISVRDGVQVPALFLIPPEIGHHYPVRILDQILEALNHLQLPMVYQIQITSENDLNSLIISLHPRAIIRVHEVPYMSPDFEVLERGIIRETQIVDMTIPDEERLPEDSKQITIFQGLGPPAEVKSISGREIKSRSPLPPNPTQI